jgi:hypothetical protein
MPADLKLPIDLVNLARLVAEEYLAHEQHTLDKVAADLRARAEAIHSSHGENGDPLADAIWARCNRHPDAPLVVDDPRTIARAAYLAVADLLGQDRTDPDVPEHARTEANQ